MNDYGNFWRKKPNDVNAKASAGSYLRRFLLGLLFWGSAISQAADGVYRWIDGKGAVHYGDHPVPGAYRMVLVPEPQPAYRVKRVYDGDTLQLENGDKVRLLGINTPEIESPRKSGEPGGEEARVWLQNRLNGQSVRLEDDSEARDHYGRRLAHVYVDGGEHINLSLVRQGLAFVDIHPPNVKHAALLLEAERQAEKARLGLWQRPEYAVRALAEIRESFPRGWQRLVGRVERIENTRAYRSLIFAGGFQARIPRANLGLFPDPTTYIGQRVEVRGWVYRYHDDYAMQLKHPAALRP